MDEVKKHLLISGRVQGVGFRAFVLKNAEQLNITGWVKNTYSGDVEAIICGDNLAVKQMIKKLQNGPRWAHVDSVESISDSVEKNFTEFRIRS